MVDESTTHKTQHTHGRILLLLAIFTCSKTSSNVFVGDYLFLKCKDSLQISSLMSCSSMVVSSKSKVKGEGHVGSSLISWRLARYGCSSASSTFTSIKTSCYYFKILPIARSFPSIASKHKQKRTCDAFRRIKNKHLLSKI